MGRGSALPLACQKPKDLGYPEELWTTRRLAAHARRHGPGAGHPQLAQVGRGTISKILRSQPLRPHRISYYLERRDPEFERKMAEVLCVYRELALWRAVGAPSASVVAVLSYDDKPGIQAIANVAPDLPPVPGRYPTVARDYEYRRHGTVSLLAGIDLVTGQVWGLVKDRHRSAEFIFTPVHGSWLNLVESFFGKLARTLLRGMRVSSKAELKERILRGLAELNEAPVVFRWTKVENEKHAVT